jgi:hypothetical protein
MAARSRSDRAPQPRSDLWTGLLVLSFLAQIAGCTFLAIEYFSYPDRKPPALAPLKPPAPPPAPVAPGQP